MKSKHKHNLQMEEVVHKVGDDSETFILCGVVAEGGQFSSLEAVESFSTFIVQDRAIIVEPVNGFGCYSVPVLVINEREGTVRY